VKSGSELFEKWADAATSSVRYFAGDRYLPYRYTDIT
jgi:hypothetical protein